MMEHKFLVSANRFFFFFLNMTGISDDEHVLFIAHTDK